MPVLTLLLMVGSPQQQAVRAAACLLVLTASIARCYAMHGQPHKARTFSIGDRPIVLPCSPGVSAATALQDETWLDQEYLPSNLNKPVSLMSSGDRGGLLPEPSLAEPLKAEATALSQGAPGGPS